MLLLPLAIAPGLAICIYIFYHDVYDREPGANLIMSFIWGMFITIPAIILEIASRGLKNESVIGIVFSTFFFIALVEEFCKFLPLRFYCFNRKSFDEPLDGIVYSIMVSMGFATVENITYIVFDNSGGLTVGIMRMFTSVPAHATFAIIMGYYTGKAKFDYARRSALLMKGVLAATFAHGMYDSFLFLNGNSWIRQYMPERVAGLLLFAGAVFSLFICIRLSRKLIGLHRLISQQLFKTAPMLTIRNASKQDIPLIRTLAHQIWPQTYSPILSSRQIIYMMELIYSENSLSRQMDNDHQFIVVYNAGVPIGFASYSEIGPTIFKLHKIYLLQLQQGRGTGKFVIQQIINDIKPRGASALQLNVNRNNAARNFYEKLGFQVIDTQDIDIGGGFFMNDFVMEKKLQESKPEVAV